MMCLVSTLRPLLPPLHLFGRPKEHLVVAAELVWESLGASSFYEILVSLWACSVALCLPTVYWCVNQPHLAEEQMDRWIGVE